MAQLPVRWAIYRQENNAIIFLAISAGTCIGDGNICCQIQRMSSLLGYSHLARPCRLGRPATECCGCVPLAVIGCGPCRYLLGLPARSDTRRRGRTSHLQLRSPPLASTQCTVGGGLQKCVPSCIVAVFTRLLARNWI